MSKGEVALTLFGFPYALLLVLEILKLNTHD